MLYYILPVIHSSIINQYPVYSHIVPIIYTTIYNALILLYGENS